MSTENGKRALKGDWVEIGADQFQITEDVTMTFEGESCSAIDANGNKIFKYDQNDGHVIKDVDKGTRCDIMKAFVKFVKR